jgi:diadenosine tetraphosphate (Ap4A) HIT family hydrolase
VRKIQDLLGEIWRVDCTGCAIGSGKMEPPGGIISENDSVFLHQDPEVPIPGFLVVGSRRHVRSLNEMSPKEQSEFTSLLCEAQSCLSALPEVESITIVQEERSAHFHTWLFPWQTWMTDMFGTNSLTHLGPIMAHAKSHRKNPDQLDTILKTVGYLKEQIHS